MSESLPDHKRPPVPAEPPDAYPAPGWLPGGALPQQLLAIELELAGYDGRASAARDAIVAAARDATTNARRIELYRRTLDLPVDPKFPYDEPDELDRIRALRPSAARRRLDVPHDEGFLHDRLYGAWLGRSVGCTLGGPAETFRPATRKQLRTFMQAIAPDEWPLKDYLPLHSPSGLTFRGIKTDATRGNIRYVPQDDDLTHTVLSQIALESVDHPAMFETQDLARTWYRYLPYRLTEGGTAMMAFRNLTLRYPMRRVGRYARGEDPIDWKWVREHSNPYREDIDAAIRADHYGYVAPGDPQFAADLAWRDGRASNVKNGLYCGMLYAAMIAAAFAMDDPEAIIEAGLAEIPATSRLHEAARRTIRISHEHRHSHPDVLHDAIYEAFGDDHNSIINNMALVLSALIVGGHDFEKVVTLAVMGGWDADCTGATAGSVAGAMLGASRLPRKWTQPLNDTLYTGIPGYEPIPISELARRSVALARKTLTA